MNKMIELGPAETQVGWYSSYETSKQYYALQDENHPHALTPEDDRSNGSVISREYFRHRGII